MSAGQVMVCNVSYLGLEHPGLMVVAFHAQTPQVDGVRGALFYSRSEGSPECRVFAPPRTGIHGWHLKTDAGKDAVAKLELAVFRQLPAS